MTDTAAPSHLPRTRSIRFDVLKCIALLGILLAHVGPPDMVLQLRSFDIGLLVLISGAVYSLSSSGKKMTYGQYVKKRVMRLIIPVWLFFILYFSVGFFLSILTKTPLPYTAAAFLGAFTLQDSFPYVWIIRVLVLVSLLTPLLTWERERSGSDSVYLLRIAASMIAYFLVLFALSFFGIADDGAFFFLYNWILFSWGYACIFALGLCVPSMKPRMLLAISCACFLLWVTVLSLHLFPPTTGEAMRLVGSSRPPDILYLSYALCISFFLLFFVSDTLVLPSKLRRFVLFVAQGSLWIYLWHIFYLSILNRALPADVPFEKLGILLVFVLATVRMQQYIVMAIITRAQRMPKVLFFLAYLKQ